MTVLILNVETYANISSELRGMAYEDRLATYRVSS